MEAHPEWPFKDDEWPAIVIPKGSDEGACAKALIMRCGSYEAAREALDRNKDWHPGPPERPIDDRVLLDIAHSLPMSDNAALTEVANRFYTGKAAAAALRRFRYMLPRKDTNSEFTPLHRWWRKRWLKFLEPGGKIILGDLERFRRRRPEK
jgi:hypothetical protein